MTNIPYPGQASFETSGLFTQVELFSGPTPAPTTEDFPVAALTSLAQFSVVGVNAAGNLAMATDGDDPGAVAIGTLTFSGAGAAADTITIGARVYTLAVAADAADKVKIGANATATALNLIAAINGAAGAGDTYGAGTVPHADVTARSNGAGVVGVVANEPGVAGNAIATTETGANTAFGAATLAGGLDASGIAAIGVLVVAVETGAGVTTRAPIYRSGNFNPAALVWHESFATDAEKASAFRGAPTPTNILIRKRL